MGLSPFRNSASHRETPRPGRYYGPPDPNPFLFEIVKRGWAWGHLIVEVHYPGVTTFEGRKLLLFDKSVKLEHLQAQAWIDPHFSDAPGIHPVARFRPDALGWRLASACARELENHGA